MSEVIVVGSFKAQPGKEAEAVEAFKALVDPHLESEHVAKVLERADELFGDSAGG
jgi:quinol monooxygenase YgiN